MHAVATEVAPRVNTAPYTRHGLLVRLAYLIVSIVWEGAAILRMLRRPSIVVLCYHGVTARQRASFDAQIRRIRCRAINTARLRAIDEKTARPRVCLTFDDAFANLTENALQAMKDAGVPASLFVVAGNMGRRPGWDVSPQHADYHELTMTADEVLQAARSELVTVGSHTQSHPRLAELDEADIRRELSESARTLEGIVGRPVRELALPHGSYDHRVVRVARELGYTHVYTLEERGVLAEDAQVGVFGRFVMSPDAWPFEFLLTIRGAYSWLGPWRRIVRSIRARCRAPNVARTERQPECKSLSHP